MASGLLRLEVVLAVRWLLEARCIVVVTFDHGGLKPLCGTVRIGVTVEQSGLNISSRKRAVLGEDFRSITHHCFRVLTPEFFI